jgi:hypothetical protein
MKTKEIIIFSAGFAIGYLFVKKNWNTKVDPIVDKISEKASEAVDTIKEAVNKEDESIVSAECEAKWLEHSKQIRYANANAKQISKELFIAECKSK